MTEARRCRDCTHWISTAQWRGNCQIHHWNRDKWAEDADTADCPNYKDKYAAYQTASKEVR